jgi:hypothetical protein
MRPWRQVRPHREYAPELVLIAATTGEEADVERADSADGTSATAWQLVVTMPHGSYSLGETAAKQKMVRLVCDKCGRRGQYRIDRLLERYGPDIAMPDLRHELAQMPASAGHEQSLSGQVPVKYVDDWRIFFADRMLCTFTRMADQRSAPHPQVP